MYKLVSNKTPKFASCASGTAKRVRFLAVPWLNR